MLTLIRLGSLKLLHVITQNNLNTSTRVQCSLRVLKAGVFSQERQRRYLSLSPWDKATLSLVRLELTFRRLLGPHRRASSSCLCLSGPCDSLQQDGEDCGVLLHPVPALLGVPGTWAGVWRCTVSSPQAHLWSRFRCCTRPRGARASAETAPLSVLKSQILCPRTLFGLLFADSASFLILRGFCSHQVRRPPPPVPRERPEPLSQPPHPGERRLVWMLACPAEEI